MSLHLKLTGTRFNSTRTNANKNMHSESTVNKGKHVHLCLTIQHIKFLGLANMFSGHSPSGKARASTANVFCVMMKCDMVSDVSDLDSLLNRTMVTSDVRLLHQPKPSPSPIKQLLWPQNMLYCQWIRARHFTFASSPRTRQLAQEGLRSQKMFYLKITYTNKNASYKTRCSANP